MDLGPSFEVPNFTPIGIQIANNWKKGEVIHFLGLERESGFIPPYENISSLSLLNHVIPELTLNDMKGI